MRTPNKASKLTMSMPGTNELEHFIGGRELVYIFPICQQYVYFWTVQQSCSLHLKILPMQLHDLLRKSLSDPY